MGGAAGAVETVGDGAELLRRAEDAAVVSDGGKSDRNTREMNPRRTCWSAPLGLGVGWGWCAWAAKL